VTFRVKATSLGCNQQHRIKIVAFRSSGRGRHPARRRRGRIKRRQTTASDRRRDRSPVATHLHRARMVPWKRILGLGLGLVAVRAIPWLLPGTRFHGRSFRRGCSGLPGWPCDFFGGVAPAVDPTGSPLSGAAAVCSCSRCRSGSSCERGPSASGACDSCRRRPRRSCPGTCRIARTRSRCRTGRTYRRTGCTGASGVVSGSGTR